MRRINVGLVNSKLTRSICFSEPQENWQGGTFGLNEEGWGGEEARREVGGAVEGAARFVERGAGSVKDAVRASRTGIAEQDPIGALAKEARGRDGGGG